MGNTPVRGRTPLINLVLMTLAGQSKQDPVIAELTSKTVKHRKWDDSKFQNTAKSSLMLNLEITLQLKMSETEIENKHIVLWVFLRAKKKKKK